MHAYCGPRRCLYLFSYLLAFIVLCWNRSGHVALYTHSVGNHKTCFHAVGESCAGFLGGEILLIYSNPTSSNPLQNRLCPGGPQTPHTVLIYCQPLASRLNPLDLRDGKNEALPVFISGTVDFSEHLVTTFF